MFGHNGYTMLPAPETEPGNISNHLLRDRLIAVGIGDLDCGYGDAMIEHPSQNESGYTASRSVAQAPWKNR